MEIKEFILRFGDEAKKFIAYYEQFKELSGAQRKERVIEVLGEWVEKAIESLPINFVLKLIIKKLIISALPQIVQVAFNLIKSKVDGITK